MFPAARAVVLLATFTCLMVGVSVQVHPPGDNLLLIAEEDHNFWKCPKVHDRVPKSGIVLKHFAKCGGGSVVRLLEASIGSEGEGFATVHERQQLGKSDIAGDNFVIGLVRNPFERYVSAWSWQSREGSQLRQSLSASAAHKLLGAEEVVGGTADDRDRFKEYMRRLGFNSSTASTIGYYSLNFFLAYMAVETDLPSYDCKFGLQQGMNPPTLSNNLNLRQNKLGSDFNMDHFYEQHVSLLEQATVAMANLTTGSLKNVPVSCWIRTEHLSDDTRMCLAKYEKQKPAGVRVNWAAFDHALASLPHVHAVEHAPCDQLYDRDLRETVLRRDGAILRAFGYPEGCNPEQ